MNTSAPRITPILTEQKQSVELMLVQHRIRWATIMPALGQCLVFAGHGSTCSVGNTRHLTSTGLMLAHTMMVSINPALNQCLVLVG